MTNLRKSLDRGMFQKQKYLERKQDELDDPETTAMLGMFDSWAIETSRKESDPEWKIENLEYDLRTSDYIYEKCKKDSYAQNLYAALCNNDFTKNDVWPVLQGKKWYCSWRYAGGIVADIRQEGDYIDWYCSGIRGGIDMGGGPEEDNSGYVGEGCVTEEIRDDLLKIGWLVVDDTITE